ncbi:hypothetical protein [Parashewanella tropica]|uniref:hypothetical protein n=1 Tax=Parashewanella tropica TaxID=2547970 RepID=UPI00105A2C4A|nr:hypothetical protein [Parashewanella tropica]
MNQHLSESEVHVLIDSLGDEIHFEQVRPHNKGEIRRQKSLSKSKFKEMISEAIEYGHQPGGDLELRIPAINKMLVGHHDGIYWLE